MESIEQPFDSITRIGQDMPDTHDKTGLIDTDGPLKHVSNGDSPGAECSPLHQLKTTNSILYGPQNRGLRMIIITAIVFAVAITVALVLTIYLEPKQFHGHAAVACDDVRCSEIGLQVLKDGGNAVDATVAAAFCLVVVNPAHAGIGGGGFALVHDHKFKKSLGYNFRERAPFKLNPEQVSNTDFGSSVLSAGVPGLVKGLRDMHEKHGRLQWPDLIQPAIKLASGGFLVSEELARLLGENGQFVDPSLRELFMDGGNPKVLNDTIVWTSLASTLRSIAQDSDSLYSGSLMESVNEEISRVGGVLSEEDLRNYTVLTPAVLETKFKELTVVTLAPPAGGALVALILKMADKIGWKDNQANVSLTYHQLIEIYKFVYAHRALLGDPLFNDGMEKLTEAILSDEFVAELTGMINDNQTYPDPKHYGPFSPGKSSGTSHLSVIDSSELMVSATISMNSNFGSKIYLKNTGILLNNVLTDFDLTNLTAANGFASNKQPQSSMSPSVLYNAEHPCNHRLIIGGSGGMKITTGVSESIINAVVFKQNISSAICSPRVHNELVSNTLYEEGISNEILDDLRAKGNTMELLPVSSSSMVTGIEKSNDEIRAYADYRKFGGVAVY
ncbi:unnamed protein product [Lymnaea stagnalis]|uniref:Uncharacterized protein n=1 Tax=Lymnaea stagnalis TaxID=6523 RepID=A0AAV2HGB2_LYMST